MKTGMRDVSLKAGTFRTARAFAVLAVAPATIEAVRSGHLPKADPLAIARVAAVQAAKQTSILIPYCHQVPLDFVGVEFQLKESSIEIETEVKAIWKTGVEMEALAAASAAALTLYDMLKIIDETMEIGAIRLLEKKGGKSGSKLSGAGRTAAVVVLSDSVSQGKDEDRSGRLLVDTLRHWKFDSVEFVVLPDDENRIAERLTSLADAHRIDLIITTGGTGLSPRDVTPEATLRVIDRRLTGIESALHGFGQDRITTSMLSRAVAGVRGKTIIINIPGSLRAVEESSALLFPAVFHAFAILEGKKH